MHLRIVIAAFLWLNVSKNHFLFVTLALSKDFSREKEK